MIRNEVYDKGELVEVETIDLVAGTLVREVRGVEVERRALSTDDVARYNALYGPPLPTPEGRLAAARQALAALDALPAPVLTADVVDVLEDLRSVL